LNLPEVPSAFQGRIGSFKGLWVVNSAIADSGIDLTITVRESQRKYKTLPQAGLSEFELLRHSYHEKIPVLSSELIQALEGCGVPCGVFEALQQDAFDSLCKSLSSLELLQQFVANRVYKTKFHLAVERFIDTGMPWDEPNFIALRRRFFCKHACQMSKELRIPVPNCARLWIAPDFSRSIPKGKCFLQLHGHDHYCLAGRTVLLLRSPCYHPCHVLKLTVIDAPVLADSKPCEDVVLLSTAEDIDGPSDAERMGGDCDGDNVLVIWDSRIVEAACPPSDKVPAVMEAPVPSSPRTVGSCSAKKLSNQILEMLKPALHRHSRFRTLCKNRRDWVEMHGFDTQADELTKLCVQAADCAYTGFEVPKMDPNVRVGQPHWTRPSRSSGGVVSERACGRLWKDRSLEVPKIQFVGLHTLLAPHLLQLERWSCPVLTEAVELVHSYCCFTKKRVERVRARPLSQKLKHDVENILLRCDTKDRTAATLALQSYGQAMGRQTAQHDCHSHFMSVLQKLTFDTSYMVWRIFEIEILRSVAEAVHGRCPRLVHERFPIDPTLVRFTHNEISPTFKNGNSILESLRSLLLPRTSSGFTRRRDFPLLQVRWYRGNFYTLGNRRLALFRLYKFSCSPDSNPEIEVVRVSDEEARHWDWASKFNTGQTGGRSVKVRELNWVIGETAHETTMRP